ncbi:dystrophin-like isoform X2 [Periplaneta americana]
MINGCNIIKYAAYRTAAKLRVLQRALYMDSVRLGLVAGVFEKHNLKITENGVDLEYDELEAVIFDIFFAAQKENLSRRDVDLTTELMINLLLNIYDGKKNGMLQVLSVKVALTVLSSADLQEKYRYLFSQLADHNNCISSNKFEILLKNLTHITEYLNESTVFGSKFVTSSVDSCFQQSHGTIGITEDIFVGWLLHEPQLLIWLSTMFRMQVAESVSHSVKCGVCKVYPIMGLRYRCLECLRYNQCQTCFFVGKVSKRHKLRHPIQEYCYETSSRESTLAFFKMLKNKLCGNSSKLQYLSVQPFDIIFESSHSGDDVVLVPSRIHDEEKESLLNETEASSTTLVHDSSSLDSQPLKELQSIISRLEEENRHLQQTIDKLSGKEERRDMCDCLRKHHVLVQAQVERLKKLKRHFSKKHPHRHQQISSWEHLQSTPLLTGTQKHKESSCFDDISPIVKETEVNKLSAGMRELQLLTWQMKRDSQDSEENETHSTDVNDATPMLPSLSDVSARDISTWVGGGAMERVPNKEPSGFSTWIQEAGHSRSKQNLEGLNKDLDEILERLQEMLASSFSLEESFTGRDNTQLQQGAREVEDLLAGLIKSVETQKTYSNLK